MEGVLFVARIVLELERTKHSAPAVTGAHSANPHVLMQESANPDASVVMGEHFVAWTVPMQVS